MTFLDSTPGILLLKMAMVIQKMMKLKHLNCLASVAHSVTKAFEGAELEDGLRTGVRLKRLHAHCGVCTSPTVMLNPLWGVAWLWGWGRGYN